MGSLKKRLCNPPAEEMAAHGDPLVLGYFRGAGAALDLMTAAVKEWFEKEVVAIEAAYIDARQSLSADTVAEMRALFDRALSESSQTEEVGKPGKGLGRK